MTSSDRDPLQPSAFLASARDRLAELPGRVGEAPAAMATAALGFATTVTNGAGAAMSTVTGAARSVAETAATIPAHAGRAVVHGVFGRLTQRIRALVEQAIVIAFGVVSAAACYFGGLFGNIGLEFLTVVDKPSLMWSIFLGAAVLTCLRVLFIALPAAVAELLPGASLAKPQTLRQRLVGQTAPIKAHSRAARFRTSMLRASAWIAVLISFSMIMLGLEHGALFLVGAIAFGAIGAFGKIRLRVTCALIAAMAFGFLRAEHLMSSAPSMRLQIRSPADIAATVPANIVISGSQGLLYVASDDRMVRFTPWERISAVEALPRRRLVDQLQSIRDRAGW